MTLIKGLLIPGCIMVQPYVRLSFTVPEDTYICNFIYRTDLNGSDSNIVSIAEGDDQVQVWDGADWVEANGFEFTMKHAAVSTHRGNTKYQERLKFRMCDVYKGGSFDTRGTTKTISITKIQRYHPDSCIGV